MMHDVEPGCAVICFQSEECIHVVEADTEYVFFVLSSDATEFRILQIYANEERLSGATANKKEDGWAHVIVLLVDKHTQWKKVGSVSHSLLFVCTDLI